jgi:hypothetical protein
VLVTTNESVKRARTRQKMPAPVPVPAPGSLATPVSVLATVEEAE